MNETCDVCDRKVWHCECPLEVPVNPDIDQFIQKEHNKNFPENKEPDEI